ncbi:MAG: nitrous oxide reductase accessory protein NosL, partial [Hoeflea sp.]|nr:nitrous oxide reductase accessory protein NosL [Hoeflea sp.]
MKRLTTLAAIVAAAISLAACSEQQSSTEMPLPVALSEEAVGHYCNMTILEHTGPKAQIHLANNPHPLWFSQVRDGIAFIRSPEETYEAVVVYVNDMGKASDWDFPGFETWID